MILAHRTHIPSHVIRRDAYDARTDGHHMTLSEWLGAKRAVRGGAPMVRQPQRRGPAGV